jgi:hypothetical protein
MKTDDFITKSIDLHLFFMRIMKEHMFFIEVAFTPQNFGMQEAASKLKERANNLLSKVVAMANNRVSVEAVESGDFVTKHTLNAENATSYYTKIPFDTNITQREYELVPTMNRTISSYDVNIIMQLNNEAHQIVSDIIEYKTALLDQILKCSIFTTNYPLLIDHILREAKYYLMKIERLQYQDQSLTPEDIMNEEIFWNTIMAEHSKFIRGLLDPTEDELLNVSNMFANEFDELTKEAKMANNKVYESLGVTRKSLDEVQKIRAFKEQGTEGLLNCKIKSIILPLLADHTLREANHYFKLLKTYK